VASLSLWYLHLAAVTAYADRAEAVLEVGRDGADRFKSMVLRPTVTAAAGSDVGRARTLHQPAHEKCFIANSVNFPVECEPEIVSVG
jgi:organic hydroperoxide reductase OsmC/OhrA